MQDKRKMKLLIGACFFLFFVIAGLLIFVGSRFMTGEGQFTGSVDQSQKQTTSEYHSQESTEESNHATVSSESQSSGTQSASESEKGTETSVELLRNFFSVFYTWDLDTESVTKRQELLKGLMSEDLYEQRSIEADSEILKELITTYQKTKEINTSNSTQLLSSRYLSSQIYQDTTDANLYRVTVRFEQKAPYQDEAFINEATYNVRYLGDQVTTLTEENGQARSDSNASK